ncbi:hypothetical protein [uncultured Roseovarius sp.]|uniref:hypothetical protein n=1 Tax=uncultured Roseovarius sp. TaxID=293344 RepID=UPI00261D881A|nr:hypothetical protein [uncultured Roseovarius sp.]
MNFVKKFFQGRKRDRLIRQLNEANTFQKLQQANMSEEQIEARRRRQASAHERQKWLDSARELNLHEIMPDSEEGRAFLAKLDAGDIHYLASNIYYDGPFDEDWAMACLLHPKCDLGTGWQLFLGSGSPMSIEEYLWENDAKKNPLGIFEADVHRNDAILKRMNTVSFASRDYAPSEPERVLAYETKMHAALSEGKKLRWHIPDDAFIGLKGLEAETHFERNGDDILEAFEIWLAKNDPDQ